jgi:chorismate synthase
MTHEVFRVSNSPHPSTTSDEKAAVIADIRRRLPFVAIGHPDLAAAIAYAIDRLETGPQEEARQNAGWVLASLEGLPELPATSNSPHRFDYGRRFREIERQMIDDDMARRRVGRPTGSAQALAEAMLEA